MQWRDENQQNQKPPIFTSWAHWYSIVLVALLVYVLIFYYITLQFQVSG